ncbi:MAG: GNAT family N-acetyltransferase [Candidatus Obscuribacterales bacterium]|nr:GNAT family N-acetyltransferase [Candidatus Obscuribacterales bacterium]
MELRLKNSTIREWRRQDEVPVLVHANDKDIWINLTDRFPYPYTRKDSRDWIEYNLRLEKPMNFAIEVDGEPVGGIGIGIREDVRRLTAEIGYWLGKNYWGRGIVTEALTAFSDYCFKNYNLCRLEASVFEWNPASMRVLEKAGYEREACLKRAGVKDGKIIDLILYAKVR